jgi:hypothetical protein
MSETMEQITANGKELVREKEGCKVSLLVEPSEEWLAKHQTASSQEPKEPEPEAPTIEDRISDLEEALAMLHMEVVKLDIASTP